MRTAGTIAVAAAVALSGCGTDHVTDSKATVDRARCPLHLRSVPTDPLTPGYRQA